MKKTNQSPLPALSTKEKAVLLFIEQEMTEKGLSPSYQEICDHFGFASYNSVQNYLKQLTNKGYVSIPQNQKRAIQILHSANDFQKDLAHRLNPFKEPSSHSFAGRSSQDHEANSKVLPIPFLGRVAAGVPIERLAYDEFIDVPAHFIKTAGDYFALLVQGDSMIEEGIFDGDYLVVLSQKHVSDGDLVVASVDNESTVKRFFMKKNPEIAASEKMVELRPANPRLKSMWYAPQSVDVKGLVKALFRKY